MRGELSARPVAAAGREEASTSIFEKEYVMTNPIEHDHPHRHVHTHAHTHEHTRGV